MNRKETRVNIMIVLYQYLLVGGDIDALMSDTYNLEKKDIDKFSLAIIENALDQKKRYITYINEELKDWKFNRLGYVEQAILLMSCAEFDLKLNHAAIIINEAVELSKIYCDDEAFKLINGVLDNL